MLQLRATRFSRSFSAALSSDTGSCLVRIYPLQGIEQPVELDGKPLLIGRDECCSLTLSDDSVSRRHAVIEPVDETHVVRDLESLNGTFVNEKRVVECERLMSGDRVRFGNQIFKYLNSDRIEGQYYEVVFKMMTTDGLTSVYNKRYFLETLDREISLARRSDSSLCVVMLDLDRFKSIWTPGG